MTNAPAGMVAGMRNAVAELRRMWNEESRGQRQDVLDAPAGGETAGGAVSGRAAPGSKDRQTRLLAEDRVALEASERDAAVARKDLQAVTPPDMNTAQKAVWSLAQSAPPTLTGIAAGILTRSPALAMAIAGTGGAGVQAGATYGEAREKGASHRLSAFAATVDGLLEGVGEALPLRIALKPGSPIAARIFHTVLAEAGQESATQAMQDLNAYLTYHPNITAKEAWDNLKVAALAGGHGRSTVRQRGRRGRPFPSHFSHARERGRKPASGRQRQRISRGRHREHSRRGAGGRGALAERTLEQYQERVRIPRLR